MNSVKRAKLRERSTRRCSRPPPLQRPARVKPTIATLTNSDAKPIDLWWHRPVRLTAPGQGEQRDPGDDRGRPSHSRRERREEEDARTEDGADVQRGGRAGGEHGGIFAPIAGCLVLDTARQRVRCAMICSPLPRPEKIMPLDSVDRQMLAILQEDGRISNAALAERLHLSPSPCVRA